ncbi:DUF6221 family protein [Streptomyces sp. NPDC097941]|uniref:DUF6221 family protein n=1 Tax=Streptomyces sp. NPDC097941 TaxID=3155685 RepID=UPI003316EE46
MDLPRFHPTIAQHPARHDLARVLCDVDAKRRVLNRHGSPRADRRPDATVANGGTSNLHEAESRRQS